MHSKFLIFVQLSLKNEKKSIKKDRAKVHTVPEHHLYICEFFLWNPRFVCWDAALILYPKWLVIYHGIKRSTFFIWKWQILVTKLTELNSCLMTGEVFFYMYILCWWPHWMDGHPLVSGLVPPSPTLLTIHSAPDCAIIHWSTFKYVIIIMKVATNKLSAMSCSKSLFTQGFSFCQYLDILCRSGSDIYSR